MSQVRYQSLGPLLSGEGSRAFLGLALEEGVSPRPVVLIWAPQDIAQDAELTARLRRETQRAVVFEHPHILRVHGLVNLEQGLARITEYADGESVRRVMEVTPRIPPPLAARLVADAALGVHYAHMAGNDDGSPLVHGDLRPETLIISFQGMCKVTGYGALSVAPRERGGRRVRNRRKYSAPEQLLGGREAVNIQTDVFLLGLTLYECLTGKVPFKDAKDADTATLTEALPSLPPPIPRTLDAVVQRATAKRAQERYPSALALREAIVEAMGGLPETDVVAAFMNKLFPPQDEARGARAKVLELGIADIIRREGLTVPPPAQAVPSNTVAPAPVPVAAASPKAVAPPPAAKAPTAAPAPPPSAPAPTATPAPSVVAAAPPAVAAAPPAVATPPAPAPEASASASPPAKKSSRGARISLVFASLAIASVAAVVVSRDQLPPNVRAYLDSLTATDASDSDLPETQAPMGLADAGTPDGGTDAGVETQLELIVDPRVEVGLSDGGTLGRTPLSVPFPPGRHVLSLNNASLGIQTARTLTVNRSGRTTHRIYLNKGFVTVKAPPGAMVQVDGRKIGIAPVEELDLYEGYHRLVVTVDGARWQKNFQITPSQRLVFDVDFEEPAEAAEE
ncbi:serine/threonine protein kinase [Stigmatella sp. ncwal1]|uniref:Serine/threonine protein kinase n=1 Tax=Stigmatella ashevillensis TaxID=2995309 RepID=A0ABT5D370_9BACT|nr:serine/threonine-protein kinase [Stigmatella ashevillena]MDC0708117.1 serine/threonine protein kinase [Stigmatella ashevillena]